MFAENPVQGESMAALTISHDELMRLPVLQYRGPIVVVGTQGDLQRAWREIRRERVLGFDSETRPTFRKGQFHTPSLVQVAAGRTVFLFPLKRLDCSRALAAVLGDVRLVKAGIALSRDLSDLREAFRFTPRSIVDLGDRALELGMRQSGVRNLAGLLLGGRVTKGAQTSNWAQPHLSWKQVCYAATDAWICRELYLRFEALGLLPVTPETARTPRA